MSFGQRGGYNSGGTTGSGSSSQDAQKSPASRTSSKISYDSTGPHDERYYGTLNVIFLNQPETIPIFKRLLNCVVSIVPFSNYL